MKISTYKWVETKGWDDGLIADNNVQLVFAFGDHPYFTKPEFYSEIKSLFPKANILGCSSSGNISKSSISDNDIVVAAISFANTSVVVKNRVIENNLNIESSILDLANEFKHQKPKHLFAIADGLWLGGTKLTKILNTLSIPVTGGLAGDGDRFKESWVIANGPALRSQIALIGFYGDVSVNYGFSTGWREFGPERRVTRSEGSTVFEIDHKPALEIYTKYLGELAADLPGSGLRYPLSVKDSQADISYVRTLLAVDKEVQSLNFAGDVPEGSCCRLMKTDVDTLIDASSLLAQNIRPNSESQTLCLVVSCVGRRLVMGQISEEEIEAIEEAIGSQSTIFGFYSYGEIAPFDDALCSLHNQTTTLTLFAE